MVTRGEMLPEIRRSMLLWVGCISGALEENDYRAKLAAAGFEQISIEPTRVYRVEDAREFLSRPGIDVDAIAPQVDGKFMSAFIRAVKPPPNPAAARVAARNGRLHGRTAVPVAPRAGIRRAWPSSSAICPSG